MNALERGSTCAVLLLGYAVFALLVGLAAREKHRNVWAWALLGPFGSFAALIAILLMPALCPRCKQPLSAAEREAKTCPRCGPLAATANQTGAASPLRQD